MFAPKPEHVISPPTFGCGFCGQPPSACECNKHDQPERSEQPQTLSYVFADFGDPERFSMFVQDLMANNAQISTLQSNLGFTNGAQESEMGGPSVL